MEGEYRRVRFALPQDEDGWPPVTSEGLWTVPAGAGLFRVENTPWFVRGLANGDVVRAVEDEDGTLWATEIVEWAGYLTIRVIPTKTGALGGSLAAVLDAFSHPGVTGEGLSQYGIVSLEIGPTADLAAIKRQLIAGQSDGSLHYEEGCVSDAWLVA